MSMYPPNGGADRPALQAEKTAQAKAQRRLGKRKCSLAGEDDWLKPDLEGPVLYTH